MRRVRMLRTDCGGLFGILMSSSARAATAFLICQKHKVTGARNEGAGLNAILKGPKSRGG